MAERRPTRLDTLAVEAVKDGAKLEMLAAKTREYVKAQCAAAVTAGRLHVSDIDDATQEATIKALRYLHRYDPARAAWLTYVNFVIHSTIMDNKRQFYRRQRLKRAISDKT